jgi:hypothetical protein
VNAGIAWTLLPWAALALWAGLFAAAHRPVALRPGGLGTLLLALVAARAVAAAWGLPPRGWEWTACGAALALALVLRALERWWLLRIEEGTLRAQIEEACRGLFLKCDREADGYRLAARGRPWRMGVRPVAGGVQLLSLPRRPEGKAALLVRYLKKQYPGPFPRVRIVLQRKGS